MRWNKPKETMLVLLLAVLIWYWRVHWAVLLWVAGGLLLTGLFLPRVALLIHRGWMGLGHLMGAVVSRVILTVIFFLIILPLGLLSRLKGRNEILISRKLSSWWKTADHDYRKEDLENPW